MIPRPKESKNKVNWFADGFLNLGFGLMNIGTSCSCVAMAENMESFCFFVVLKMIA